MIIIDKYNINNIKELLELATTDGITWLIDKDRDWTSFDVVAKLRGATKIKKTGHAGTLDPLATGLLILCQGRATKQIDNFQALKKSYTTTIKLGAVTKSFDSEYDEESIKDTSHITRELLNQAISTFIGQIEQIPPMFSAKKVDGKKLYELARKGKEIKLKPSKVEIYSMEVVDYDLPVIELNISCSKGTYIRSLARDIGEKLSCGAYLKNLRRTAIGEYSVNDALKISEIVEVIDKAKAECNV